MTVGDAERFEPTPKGGDMNLICPPFGADELAWMGFDLMGCANNHAMDYGSSGLLSTVEQLNRVGIASAGTGQTLARASAPSYVDTPAGRVALINCASSFPEWSLAENARADSNGRPGINPLRVDATYRLEPGLFQELKKIDGAFKSQVGQGQVAQSSAPTDELFFLGKRFIPGPTEILRTARQPDISRVTQAIKIARRNSRLVTVMIHEHALYRPSSFLQLFARACIDAGADAFFGSGPHVVGAIELYQGKPICYSLGNFFFQYETLRQIPTEVYEANRLDINTPDPSVSYDVLSNNHFNERSYWESSVVRMQFSGSQLTEFTLHPIVLGWNEPRFSRGLPILGTEREGEPIIKRISDQSKAFGTRIDVRDEVGHVGL
jgi:poly-gamma-glutamate synthesis protein (capsule biosynthesis protein)